MTLSRKRSSPIHVDGIDYRWAVSARTLSSPELMLLVIQPENDGQRLVVTVPCDYLHESSGSDSFNYAAITPSLVRTVIAASISIGWSPTESGPELRGALQPDETVLLR